MSAPIFPFYLGESSGLMPESFAAGICASGNSCTSLANALLSSQVRTLNASSSSKRT